MPEPIELLRGVRINPDEIGPDGRITLWLDDGSSWVVEVRNGTLYVDPELNVSFDSLSMAVAREVVENWDANAVAYQAAYPKLPKPEPLDVDPEELAANARNSCRVVVGKSRNLTLYIGDEIALEFWYMKPLIHIGHARLDNPKLRSVTLTSAALQRELVA